ncbi:hypothetical protein P152DRAFT_453605 [Eremomyces bilateralis CBS 781.70]|uniref:Uncharacterized protein n=1 Tax=Eremomyces bilateralis CBS 781.70 TaxID=1392243 RepID=A0A6G1GFZ9_9PEZI|nr:uncharacterized protein P152DRAFT_453605 [Eremomyces bilateralis CBS 781.70]KAF1816998.1 hypothetical protein P152DRAFT_453605 [Eremomyces bilateralis CBS 781.70]
MILMKAALNALDAPFLLLFMLTGIEFILLTCTGIASTGIKGFRISSLLPLLTPSALSLSTLIFRILTLKYLDLVVYPIAHGLLLPFAIFFSLSLPLMLSGRPRRFSQSRPSPRLVPEPSPFYPALLSGVASFIAIIGFTISVAADAGAHAILAIGIIFGVLSSAAVAVSIAVPPQFWLGLSREPDHSPAKAQRVQWHASWGISAWSFLAAIILMLISRQWIYIPTVVDILLSGRVLEVSGAYPAVGKMAQFALLGAIAGLTRFGTATSRVWKWDQWTGETRFTATGTVRVIVQTILTQLILGERMNAGRIIGLTFVLLAHSIYGIGITLLSPNSNRDGDTEDQIELLDQWEEWQLQKESGLNGHTTHGNGPMEKVVNGGKGL